MCQECFLERTRASNESAALSPLMSEMCRTPMWVSDTSDAAVGRVARFGVRPNAGPGYISCSPESRSDDELNPQERLRRRRRRHRRPGEGPRPRQEAAEV